MGAFPALPKEPIEISELTELGPEGDAFACGGNAFFYNPEAGTIIKYDVGDDLSLTKRKSINVVLEGINGWTGAHVCVSETQAFIFNGAGGRVVEWNPKTMVIVDALDIPTPDVPNGLEVQFFEPMIADNLVYFPIGAVNWDTDATSNRAVLAVFDVRTKELTYSYDDRCQTSLGGFVDSKGNVYRIPEDGGYYRLYSPTKDLPLDCFLRVKTGETQFDPEYILKLGEGESLRSAWPIDDDHVLATLIDEGDAPEVADKSDWYTLPVKPTMINLQSGKRTPYTSVPEVQPMNSRKLTLDAEYYYQVYTFDDEDRTKEVSVVRLTRDGAEPAFTLKGGDVLTLERLW